MSVTVCLAMIVRDESPVIRRCLEAARPYIDAFAIVDVDTRTIWWLDLEGSQGKSRVRLGTPHMERYRAT